ncbi:MAG: pyrimidine 5'-nucleotidase [Pseudomonadota bacterium]
MSDNSYDSASPSQNSGDISLVTNASEGLTHIGDFAHVDTWIFDLDNTLYPRSCDLFAQIDVKMTQFVAGVLKTDDLVAARHLQKQLFHDNGTTLNGLTKHYGIEPVAFLDFVHDIDYSPVPTDTGLDLALSQLEGRKLVHTNGDVPHAMRTMERLGIAHLFGGVFDIVAANYEPKPGASGYEKFWSEYDINPANAAMFEDMARNLEVPKAHGMTTVLVKADAPHLGESWEHHGYEEPFIDHATHDLPGFLASLTLAPTPSAG